MRLPSRGALACAFAAALALPATSFATNGMFVIGYGAKARGMGGVSIAFPQDSLASAINPATLTAVGTRADASLDIFTPKASACLGLGTPKEICEKSKADLFGMPAMGMAMQFTRNLSFGMTMVGAGGGGSRYNTNLYNSITGSNVNQTLGVSLMIAQMNPTVAMKLTPHQSVGASLVIGVQQFRAFGLGYFSNFTSTGLLTDKLTNNGNNYSWGAGLRVGWLGQFLDNRLSLGAEAQSKVYMTRFKEYTDLFAEKGSFDTPANFGVGIAFKVTPDVTVGLDVTRTLYSGVRSVSNPGPNTSGSPFPVSQAVNALGKEAGLGFGWNNQTVYKAGIAYRYNSKWTFRGGYDYGKSPIPEDNGAILFNIVAPATVQSHGTVGFTYSPSRNIELTMSYIHAFTHRQYGPTFIGGSTGSFEMMQNSVGMQFSFKM